METTIRKNNISNQRRSIFRGTLLGIVLISIASSGCSSLQEAGHTRIELTRNSESGDLELVYDSGKDVGSIDIEVRKNPDGSYYAKLRAKEVLATEAIHEAAETTQEMIKAAREFADGAAKMTLAP